MATMKIIIIIIITKLISNKSVGKDVEKLEPLCTMVGM